MRNSHARSTQESIWPQRSPRIERWLTAALGWFTLVAILPVGLLAQPSQKELDARFEEMMKGTRLEGQFNVVGPQGQTPAQTDLYMVSELSRGEGDTWIFHYRMSFNQDQKMTPIPVRVLWAGETPVLTMTDQAIEGLQGTFSARILLYDRKYAGTWQHGPVGGLMWGTLVKDDRAE